MNAQAPLESVICKLPLRARRWALFLCSIRRIPNFSAPCTFNEKMNWRILNDRRSLLEWTCDKLAMKDRASNCPGLRIPRTFWAGTDLRELTSAVLPEHWVLKPNHRSGLIYFGHGRPDIEQLSAVTADWLRPVEAEEFGEWAYSKARPMLLAEEVIGNPGSPPRDYKFWVFDGDVAVIDVDVDRFTTHQLRFYLPDWSPLEVQAGVYPLAPLEPAPASLDSMLAAAAELGSGFDFIRVDLYNIGREVYFGEVTPYPSGGMTPFLPASFDAELGARWTLPRRPTS
jgi:teichuronopeptide biosynthesis TupA-like protein